MSAQTTDTSATYLDIKDIIANHSEPYSSTFSMEAKLHTVDKDLSSLDHITVVEMSILRDYVLNMSDYTEITLLVPIGTFVYDIYPYLDNIEVTLIVNKQLSKDGKVQRVMERYKAVYLLDKNKNKPTMSSASKEDLNQELPTTLTLQLLDRAVEVLRIKTTQGSFDHRVSSNKNLTVENFIRSVVSEEANKILIENKPILNHIDIEPVDNKEPLSGLVVPSNTRVVDLTDFLQVKGKGVYTGGIGSYIQNFGIDPHQTSKGYYAYSLYKPSKYVKAKNKIIIYSPLTSNLSMTDITYKYEEGLLKIVSHAIPNIDDLKESNLMSTGVGYRMANAASFMKKPVVLTEDGPVFDRARQNTEIISKDRSDGVNYAPNKGISSNHFVHTSEILEKSGSYITVEISNLDHDFIYPAASVKIVYNGKNNKVEELYGVIHKVAIKYSTPNLDVVSNISKGAVGLGSFVVLYIFVEV